MYLVFFSTSDVFAAEEELKNQDVECKIVPTPVTDKAYCGVCLKTNEEVAPVVLNDFDFERIEE